MLNPTASQAKPTRRVSGRWMTTTHQAAAVPRKPTIAKSGQSMPRKRTFGRPLTSSSSSRKRTRRPISDAFAIANESIAPNEYIVPRKSILPGSSVAIDRTPEKQISESHGVLNRGCSRRKISGIWR